MMRRVCPYQAALRTQTAAKRGDGATTLAAAGNRNGTTKSPEDIGELRKEAGNNSAEHEKLWNPIF
jgi:hypothetical protein